MAGSPDVFRPAPAAAAPREVLIIKPSSFGDVIHTLPAVNAVKRAWPGSRLHWVVNEEWSPLLQGNPDLHAVIPFPRRRLRGLRAVPGFLGWCRATAAAGGPGGGFDLALDFQGLLRSALIARGCRARTILGLSDAREGAGWFYDARADVRGIPHAVDRYLALARLAGADISNPVFPLPAGTAPAGFTAGDMAGIILLHPFARGSGKSLPQEQIDAIIRALAPRTVMLVGSPPGNFAPELPGNAVSLLGKTTLTELLWLLRHAAAMISVDSGPMHLAAALPLPLLGLHTWSDPRKVGPWRHDAWVWKNGETHRVDSLPAQSGSWAEAESGWTPALPAQIAEWAAR